MLSEDKKPHTDPAIDFYNFADLKTLEDEYETLEDLDITNSSLLKSQHIFKSVLDPSDAQSKSDDNYKQYKQSEQLKEITTRAKEISGKHLKLHQFVSEDGGGDGDVSAHIVPAVFVLHYEIENIISYNVSKSAPTNSNVSIRLTRPIVDIIDEIPEDNNIKSLFDTPDSDTQVLTHKTSANNITNDSAETFLSEFKQKVVSETPNDIDIFTTPENYYILCIFGLSQEIIKCFLVKRKNLDVSAEGESGDTSKEQKSKQNNDVEKADSLPPVVAKNPYIPYRFSFEGIIGSTQDLLYNKLIYVRDSNTKNININIKNAATAFFNKYLNRLRISITKNVKARSNTTSKVTDSMFSPDTTILNYFSGFRPKYLLNPDNLKTIDITHPPFKECESMPYFYFRSFIEKFGKNADVCHKLFEISLLCFSTIYKDDAAVNAVANNATSQSGQTPPPIKNEVLVLDDIDVSSANDKSQPMTTQSLLVNTGIYRKLKTISKAVQSAFYKNTYKTYLNKRNVADNAENTDKNAPEQSTKSQTKSVNKTKDANLHCIFKYTNKDDSLYLEPKILLHWAVFSSLIQKWIGIHDYYIVSGVFVGQNSSSHVNAQLTEQDPHQKPVDTIRKRIFRYIYSFKRDEIMTEMMAVLRNGIITNKKMIYNPYFMVNDIRSIIETRKNTYQLSEEYSKLMPVPILTNDDKNPSVIPSDSENSTISSNDLKISSVLTPEISLDINDIKVDLQSFVSPEPIAKSSDSENENSLVSNTNSSDSEDTDSNKLIGITIDEVLIEVNVAIDSAITDSLIPKTKTSKQPEGVVVEAQRDDHSTSGLQQTDPDSTLDSQSQDPPPPEPDITKQIKEATQKLKAVQEQRKALETKLNDAKSKQQMAVTPLSDIIGDAVQSNEPIKSDSQKLLEACIDAKQTIYKISIMAALKMMSQSDSKKGGSKGCGGRRRRKIGGAGELTNGQQGEIDKLLKESREVFLGKSTSNEQPGNKDGSGSDNNLKTHTEEAIALLNEVSNKLKNIPDDINTKPANTTTNSDTSIASQKWASESASESATNNTTNDPPTITLSLSFTTGETPQVENNTIIESPPTLVENQGQSQNQAYESFIVEISKAVEKISTTDTTNNPIDSVIFLYDTNVLMKNDFLDNITKKTTQLKDEYEEVKKTLLAKMEETKALNDNNNTPNENDAAKFTAIDDEFAKLITKIESKQSEVNKARDKATERDELGCLDIALYGMISEEVQKKSSENGGTPLPQLQDYTKVQNYSKWVDNIINKRTLGAVSQEETLSEEAKELIVV